MITIIMFYSIYAHACSLCWLPYRHYQYKSYFLYYTRLLVLDMPKLVINDEIINTVVKLVGVTGSLYPW